MLGKMHCDVLSAPCLCTLLTSVVAAIVCVLCSPVCWTSLGFHLRSFYFACLRTFYFVLTACQCTLHQPRPFLHGSYVAKSRVAVLHVLELATKLFIELQSLKYVCLQHRMRLLRCRAKLQEQLCHVRVITQCKQSGV